ncbi:unannotated protein [freshwater metagenome]|uniref:Unannotated protein n=1 Tax=freshwater metagenome TaxID=449393 RepID=A0A6J6R4R0_9ZZZZ|nr:hypothetical protein [Actinomycetota bacterium]
MRGQWQESRALCAALGLYLASVAGHLLAGGSSSLARALLLLLLTFVLCHLASDREWRGIRLVVALLIIQALGHALMGGVASSDSMMLLAHVSATSFGYFLVAHSERALAALEHLVRYLFAPGITRQRALPEEQISIHCFSFASIFTQWGRKHIQGRAPPMLARFN